MNIQKAFARASTSMETQTTVNSALLLEHQDQHQSVSYREVPASDLVNQNCSDISIPPVSENEVQIVYTDKPEPYSLSQDNSEVCSAPLTQVSEAQRDQSVIPSVTAYHSWFVKPKRDKLTEYFEFHPHQPRTTKFNATNVYFRPDDSGGRLQRLWLSYCEEKKLYFAIFALHMVLLLVAIRTLANLQRVSIRENTFTNELMNTKVLKNIRHVLKLTYDSAVIRQLWTYLLSVKHYYKTNRSCKEGKFSTESSPLWKWLENGERAIGEQRDRNVYFMWWNVDAKIVFYAVILQFGNIECTAEVILFYIRHTK